MDQFELYKLYLATAEKVSDRRGQANQWLLSVNSALIGLYGYLGARGGPGSADEAALWRLAIPACGVLVCLSWAALLGSYRRLNAAKFKVLQEIEAGFETPALTREQEHYKAAGRSRLSQVEAVVPWSFAVLYSGLIGAVLAL
ncbi:MAG: hypothetical protein AAFR17_11215 [Pseudomonadota bacterium]